MKIVAMVRSPEDPQQAMAALAEAADMTMAEARMRLAPEPPALLARLDDAAALALTRALSASGLAVLSVDAVAPTGARVLARSLVLDDPSALTITSRAGETFMAPWSALQVILRASSSVREKSERTERTQKFDLVSSVVSSGLKNTKTVERTLRSQSEETEQSIFVFADDGQSAMLRETALEFSCLGKALQPARTANMVALAQQLRARAPQAYFDDRLLRLGRRPLPFVVGGSEVSIHGANTQQSRVSTASGVDVLAEVIRQAVGAGLLP